MRSIATRTEPSLLLGTCAIFALLAGGATASEPPLTDKLPDLGVGQLLTGSKEDGASGDQKGIANKDGLTRNADDLSGAESDDAFSGGAGTLSRTDKIDGGRGEDILTAGLANDLSGPETPTVTNVERLFVDAQGGDLSLKNISGAREVHGDKTSLQVTEATLDLSYGARAIESGTVILDFGSDLSGSANTLSLISSDANVTFKAKTDAQNASIQRIDLAVVGEARDTEQVDISAFNKIEQVRISGANRVVLDATSPSLTRIDATSNTGGVDFDDLNSAAQDIDAAGGAGDDLILTGTGDDTLSGGEGDDELGGEAGRDNISGGFGRDTLRGNAGPDTLRGGAGDDRLEGAGGADLIEGGDGDDTLNGGNNADTLRGGRGDDVLRGGGGKNLFEAGPGANVLVGGGQADTFEISGKDTIEGFTMGQDTLSFPDGTSLSTRDEFRRLYEMRPSLFTDKRANRLTLSIGESEAVLAATDTDFLDE